MTTAIGAFGTFRLLPVVIASLIEPFGVPFRVTSKGTANDQNYFDSYTFAALALLIVITTAGLIINLIPEWAVVLPGEFGVLADYWAVVNIVVLALICFEVPRRARRFRRRRAGRDPCCGGKHRRPCDAPVAGLCHH